MRKGPLLAVFATLSLTACGKKDEAPPPAPSATEAPEAPSAPVSPAAPTWVGLDAFAGKTVNESTLLTSSPIATAVSTMLGTDFDAFKERLQTSTPLAEEGGVWFTSGNKAHEGGTEEAWLAVDPGGSMEAGVKKAGKWTRYSYPVGASVRLPADIQTRLADQ